MQRITQHMLDRKIDLLNKLTGNPESPWTRLDGRTKANIGHYHTDGAYGGVALHQMMNEGGGVHSVFSCGHITKRDLFNRIDAYIDGIRAGKGE